MKICLRNNKGFTLIELLVVIAIIDLLATIVIVNVNTARNKAKDAAIKMDVSQLATLMALNYDDYGDYCNLEPNAWITASGVTCDTMYSSGIYVAKARQLCNNIYNNAGDIWTAGAYRVLIYTSPAGCSNAYSNMAALNDGKWFCSGSSGAKGEYVYYGDPPNSNPGCYGNP